MKSAFWLGLILLCKAAAAGAVDGNPFSGFKKVDPIPQPSAQVSGSGGGETAGRQPEERQYMDLSRARRVGRINGREVWFDESLQGYVHPSEEDIRHAPAQPPSATPGSIDAGMPPAPKVFDLKGIPQLPLPNKAPRPVNGGEPHGKKA